MAKYDYGGGCPCGLYAECLPDCINAPSPRKARVNAIVYSGNQDEDQAASGTDMAPRLPTDSDARKHVPLATGVLDYFPDALAEVARLSKIGNDKHNPGQPLHWSRGKSDDHADCIMRHMIERGKIDTDGVLHDAKVAWRALAQLQLALEKLTQEK